MKNALFAKNKAKPSLPMDAALSFIPIGSNDGRPAADALDTLKAFHAKYPKSRKPLRQGQKGAVELIRQAKGEATSDVQIAAIHRRMSITD